jgi:hypothetical protein
MHVAVIVTDVTARPGFQVPGVLFVVEAPTGPRITFVVEGIRWVVGDVEVHSLPPISKYVLKSREI